MPPAVPLVAAAAGAAATSAGIGGALFSAGLLSSIGAAIVANSVAGFVVAAGVNQIGSRLFTKKPKTPALGSDAGVRTALIRSAIESHKIIYGQALVGGTLVFAKTTKTGLNSTGSGPNTFLHMVIAIAGHEVEEIGQVYLNDQPVTLTDSNVVTPPYYDTSLAKSYVRIIKHLGATDQLADSELIAQVPEWTSAHRLQGIAYVYMRLEYRSDIFIRGIPEPKFLVRGKKVYDPRTTLTAWSDNSALCVRDYLASDYGFFAPSKLNDTYFNAAANICEESVTLNAGGTEDRYTCNGVLDTDHAPIDNLQALLSSMAGVVTYVQGQFRLHAAAYDSPEGDIDPTMWSGDMSAQLRTPRKDLFNAVRGVFVDPAKSYQPTDFPPVTNATYAAQDGGETIYQDIELPFTVGSERAQRIAKIGLEKARQGIVVTLPVNYKALRYAVMDVVTLTNAQMGWTAKPFRVKKWSFSLTGGIVMTLQEESSASYDWNSGEATTEDPAPDTDLPDPFFVAPPKALEVTEEIYITKDGSGVKVRAALEWVPSQDAFLKDYLAEYKPRSLSAWTKLPRTEGTTQNIDDIAPGTYDFRVSAFNSYSVPSNYSTASKYISGLAAPPNEPQSLSVASIGGTALLTWEPSEDADVAHGGHILFRHSADTGATWAQAVSIGPEVPGSATSVSLPLKPGVYLARSRDSSGVLSVDTASVATTQATALTYANIGTLDEHPVFSGLKAFVTVDSLNRLTLVGNGFFGDIPLLSDVSSVAAYGGITTVGVYNFAGVIDKGTVGPVRVTIDIEVTIFNPNDRIGDRSTDITTWPSFTGIDGSECDAQAALFYDDTPLLTKGTGRPFHQGEFSGRYFTGVLVMRSYDDSYNIAINSLTLRVEEVA